MRLSADKFQNTILISCQYCLKYTHKARTHTWHITKQQRLFTFDAVLTSDI